MCYVVCYVLCCVYPHTHYQALEKNLNAQLNVPSVSFHDHSVSLAFLLIFTTGIHLSVG